MSKPDWSWLKPKITPLITRTVESGPLIQGPPSHQSGPRVPRNRWDVLPKEDVAYYLSLSQRKDK